MVWLAFSHAGISKPFIMQTGSMNGDLYLKESIKKRLLPFISQHHPHKDIIFWPDGATAHYKKCVQEELASHNINYVQQRDNPPNVPQLRPIEHLWSILKNLVYAGGWTAKNKEELTRRIRKKIRQIDMNIVRRMLDSVKTNIHRVGRAGIDCMN
jgi:transposase